MRNEPTLAQKALAELLGTFILVFFGGMAVILSGGASALTFTNYGDLLAVGLAFGLALAGAIHAFGKISGGHYNPAVTTALLATRRMPLNEALVYYVAQLAGAMLAALCHALIFNFDQSAMFITIPGLNIGFGSAVLAEIIGTFLLVSVIFGVAVDGRAPAGWAGWMIGMAVTAGVLALGPVSGASFNPAVSLGPRVITALIGGSAQWNWLIVYIGGPLIGGVLAALIYDFVAHPNQAAEPLEHALQSEPTVGKGER